MNLDEPAATTSFSTPLTVNGYRRSVVALRALLVALRVKVVGVVDRLLGILRAGAWQGRAADRWADEVEQARSAALTAVDDGVDLCDRSTVGQPEEVAADDPRAAHPGLPPRRTGG